MRLPVLRFLTTMTCVVLLLATPAWAVPLTGFLEGTAANGWQGNYAVQLTDGTVVTGVDQMTLLGNFSSVPLTTEGCTVSPSCVAVTNVATSTEFTMSVAVLNLTGTATLGSLGPVSWGVQPFWVLPGDPAPTAAVLATASGTLGGTTLTPSTFSFGFNSTLTTTFTSVAGGQALRSLRLDFIDGTAPPTSRMLLQGPVFIDNGVPIALGTPLPGAPASVPESSSVLLLAVALAGLEWWRRKQPAY